MKWYKLCGVIAVLLLMSALPARADTYWNVPPGQSGDWSAAANWDNGPPTSGVNAYIANGGTATVDASGGTCQLLTVDSASTLQISGGSLATGISGWTAWTVDGASTLRLNAGTLTAYSYGATAYVGNASTGTFVQSDGINQINDSIYLGNNASANGTYTMSGGTLAANNVEYIGYSGSGSFVQTGGTAGPVRSDGFANSALFLGYNSGATGVYSLTGTGQMNNHVEYIGYSGTGTVTQTGGVNNVTYYSGNSYYLYLAYKAGSNGTYNLGGSGQLSAQQEYVGYDSAATGLFQQTGGSNTTGYVSVGPGGRYVLSGGALILNGGSFPGNGGGLSSQGIIDFSDSHASLIVGAKNIIDLSNANLTNVGGMTVTVGANSLLIVPAGFNPSTAFGTFTCDSSSIIHPAGTMVVVAAGQTIGGQGSINDQVKCQGTITTVGWPLNLNNGLILSTGGSVNLSHGNLTVNDSTSGITGGSLGVVGNAYIGRGGTGLFTQSGGDYGTPHGNIFLGYNSGDSGTYKLSGGSLYNEYAYIGNSGTGDFVQTGGSNTAIHGFYLGSNAGSSGTYELGGTGSLHSQNEYVGQKGTGAFTQSGGTNEATGGGIGLLLGHNSGSSGIYNLSGGQLTAINLYVGSAGTGTFIQSGGTVWVPYGVGYNNHLQLGSGTGGSGTYDFTGGILILPSFSSGPGSAVFNFGGGTLQADHAFTTTVPVTLTGVGGNANVDTDGNQVTFSGQLSGPGGLKKIGLGTLLLSTVNSYTGDTAVNAGTLSLAYPDLYDGSSVSVAPGALLNLTYSGIDTVRSLILGGIEEPPGLYNAANSGGYITGMGSIQVAIPEPSTFALLGMGAVGLLGFAWRRRKRTTA